MVHGLKWFIFFDLSFLPFSYNITCNERVSDAGDPIGIQLSPEIPNPEFNVHKFAEVGLR